ncbi:MAG TPA: hypothetical protein VFG20_00610, partial [Planctomycetaceae bacterium]|nr:hypothetical protein [Planctomycetaceae bacterium]
LTQAYESGSWANMPAPVAILGCGASSVSTSAIVLAEDGEGPVNLSEIILRQTSYLVAQTRQSVKRHPRCALGPGKESALPEWLIRCITATANQLPGGTAERTAVAAGLHLLYDDLDGSHSLAQTAEGQGKHRNADYWHAIMHRREPDYGNAKYWFRRVGAHVLLDRVRSHFDFVRERIPSALLEQWADRLVTSAGWNPLAFVDACEAASENDADPEFRRALEEIQHYEMVSLLAQSCRDAGFVAPQRDRQ